MKNMIKNLTARIVLLISYFAMGIYIIAMSIITLVAPSCTKAAVRSTCFGFLLARYTGKLITDIDVYEAIETRWEASAKYIATDPGFLKTDNAYEELNGQYIALVEGNYTPYAAIKLVSSFAYYVYPTAQILIDTIEEVEALDLQKATSDDLGSQLYHIDILAEVIDAELIVEKRMLEILECALRTVREELQFKAKMN